MQKNLLRISFFIFIILSVVHSSSLAQNATVKGVVRDSIGKPLDAVTVAVKGSMISVVSNASGNYEIQVPSGKVTLTYYLFGTPPEDVQLDLKDGETVTINRNLKTSAIEMKTVTVVESRNREPMIMKIDPRAAGVIPSPSGNFESILKTLPGVTSNNELSSTYSVRGGNYDENLVYVNGIEIYRPFLVRSGQQEGLSFVNSDLVSSVAFSAGGFSASYGDKLSSVLDIRYNKPKEFKGSAYASLLGGGFHLEGINKKKSITYLLGVRQKSNQFLLKNLDTKGEYKPSFTDVQSLLNFKLSNKTELSFLGNYSRNRYEVIPTDRETEFGNITNDALRFTVFFEGREIDKYSATQGALSLLHQPDSNVQLRLTTGVFYTKEQEYFDIIGAYRLDELDKDLGSSGFGEVAFNRGVGAFLNHARNDLDALVYYAEHKGLYIMDKAVLSWGVKAQHESITDKLDEWVYRDSADFSVSHPADHPGDTLFVDQKIVLNDVIKSENDQSSNRFNSFVQINRDFENVTLTAGVRATYWDLNSELDISPRVSVQWKPSWNKHLAFRAATGFYYQPPFYREMRNFSGEVNTDINSQRSIHYIIGSDYQFLAWGREFKLTAEAYYKQLHNLIPYKTDNLRLRYFAKNSSDGYAYGADMRINGEFVNGIESWVSVSYLKTEEDIRNDYIYTYYNADGEKITRAYPPQDTVSSTTVAAGYIPRPADQRLTFSLFFQDYLPKFPSFRMHLTLIFGTGLPFGPPGNDRYRDIIRMPTYRRVDIGFTKIIIDEDKENKSRMPVTRKLNSLWFSLEVFNLLQVNNTVSYTWITDVTGRQYAVPNYLSSRLINAKLTAKF